ncbi:MAG: DUF975 family protein [Patescibacteria group bacterium]
METKKVETGQAISYGWTEVKKNFWYFVGLAVIVCLIESITSGYGRSHYTLDILGIFLSTWMACGYTRLVLDYQAGNKRPLADVFTQVKPYWRVFGANLIIGIIVAIGFILLIVPGIYLALRFLFTIPLIIDKNLGIEEAMKQSTAMTKGIKMPLFGFGLTALGVIILGAIVFGVGVFVALPVVWLAYISLYKRLSASPVPANPQ